MSASSEKEETALVVPNPSALTDWNPTEFAAALAAESQKRKDLEGYIRSHLKEGVDYGTISFGSRESKPTLFKPGGEKVASLLKLRPSFRADADTLKMLGEVGTGVLAYICTLSTAAGEVVGEGRGSAGPEKADVNTRIKIALKRAMLDAVLRVAALSDHFTQDLDDMDPPPGTKAAPAPKGESPRKNPTSPASTPPSAPTSAAAGKPGPGKVGVIFPFGKHKGKDVGEVETGYLEWAEGKPFNEDDEAFGEKNKVLNATIREVLKRRRGKDLPGFDRDAEERKAELAREDAGPDQPPPDLDLSEIPF